MIRFAGSDFMLLCFKAPSRRLLKKSEQTVAVPGLAHAHHLGESGTCTLGRAGPALPIQYSLHLIQVS